MTSTALSSSATQTSRSQSSAVSACDCCCQPRGGSREATWLQRRVAGHVAKRFHHLSGGKIFFDLGHGGQWLGQDADDSLSAELRVHDPRLFRHLLTSGSLGLADSYIAGHWVTDDLTALLRILYRNQSKFSALASGFGKLRGLSSRIARALTRNTLRGSRRNIAAHYDLGNDFFELFLDPSLTYSAGFYEHRESTLGEASLAKLERLCQKLRLVSQDRVMEIGSGWGSFAIHAATVYGSHVTTTTISRNQFQFASRRVAELGLSERVDVLQRDYRELTGRFDKLVSIEMIEAVGEAYLDTFFRGCDRLLRPGGRLAMQAIVMPEQRYDAYRKSVDFIQEYIFPGGFLPSVSRLCQSAGTNANLNLDSLEDLSPHYARTLSDWRRTFFENLDEIRKLGISQRFIRLWEYYLCYCEAAFREQAVRVVQIVWDKPRR